MSKGMFDRLFKFLVKKCNETLDTNQKRQSFIGVLDIAGFEIFDVSYTYFYLFLFNFLIKYIYYSLDICIVNYVYLIFRKCIFIYCNHNFSFIK